MPTTSAPTTSSRLLALLSLLQARRDWPGGLLATRPSGPFVDDEQAVALAVALRIAVGTGAGIEEAAARALTTFLAARFKGSDGADVRPCRGEVVLACPAADVVPYAADAVVEPLGADRCRVALGAWSWAGLAASLARFDVDVTVVGPPELRDAFAALSDRASRAARS